MYSSPAISNPATPRDRSNPSQSQPAQQCHRLMQVKVLYTFDDGNKTNCLARCPQPLHIKTAFLDSSSEIGIIELRSCIQAIVAASPELIAKLGQDYTVYAYDYSEYETPLVGQGMLSWVLASASATPNAPAQQSRTMVTGRVCKNILGLFSEGLKETLEVKLRLLPVPTCLQSEYLASMQKYRDASNLAAEGIDVGAWTTFIRANPGFGPASPALEASSTLLPQLQHDAVPQSDAVNSATFQERQMSDFVDTGSRPASRNGTSGVIEFDNVAAPRSVQPGSAPAQLNQSKRKAPARPTSRASNRGRQESRPRAGSLAESQQDYEIGASEGAPSRKRARTTKADWRGPSTFSASSESLRVTASTAASIRGHSLQRTHPTASELASGDFGNRPPTPRPHASKKKQAALSRQNSLLYNEVSSRHQPDGYMSPYPVGADQYAMTSPDAAPSSVSSTPANMPSSPPIPRFTSPSPSISALPNLMYDVDSGFASGAADDYLGDADDETLQNSAQYLKNMAVQESELSIVEEMPGDRTLLPSRILPRVQRAESANRREVPQLESALNSNIPPQEDRDALDMSEQRLQSDTPKDERSPAAVSTQSFPLKRSQSSMSDQILALNMPSGLTEVTLAPSKQKTGTSLKRKKAVQERLQSSIAAGEIPPFCRNCGEISTPTWRKAFVKIVPGLVENSVDNDDGFVVCEPMEKDQDGVTRSHRIVRKVLTSTDDGFEEIQLCNPCGIYLFKNRAMRPPEMWTKAEVEPAKSKRRSSKRPTVTGANAQNDQPDSEIPVSISIEQPEDVCRAEKEDCVNSESVSQNRRERAVSLDLPTPSHNAAQRDRRAIAALKRAIQSSPPRFPGSRYSPIDLDADISPRPIRRLLFLSPRRAGEMKSLESRASQDERKEDLGAVSASPSNSLAQDDKENQPPPRDAHDDDHLDRFFAASATSDTPQTPISGSKPHESFRTPTSSARRRMLVLNQFLSPWKRTISAPTTPSRLMSVGASGALPQMTPFTAQMTQLLSDANLPEGVDISGLDIFGGDLAGFTSDFNFDDFTQQDMVLGHMTDLPDGATFSLYEDPVIPETGEWNKESIEASIQEFLQADKLTITPSIVDETLGMNDVAAKIVKVTDSEEGVLLQESTCAADGDDASQGKEPTK